MLSREELEIYGDELVSENCIEYGSIELLGTVEVENIEGSSDFVPKSTESVKDMSWVDQWMALSEDYSGICKCAACGKVIFVDVSDPACIKMARMLRLSGVIENCTPDMLQVQGGHIVLKNDISDGQNILARKGSIFIVPLCKTHNHYSVKSLTLRPETIITPEIRQEE